MSNSQPKKQREKKKGSGGGFDAGAAAVEYDQRPSGMLVQRRTSDGAGASNTAPPSSIRLRIINNGSSNHDISVPSQSTFGDLKRILSPEVGLQPQEQRLLFMGKERDNGERLHMAGVKDMSKLVLMEDKGRKDMSRAIDDIALVRANVGKLSVKVSELRAAIDRGMKVEEKEFLVLTELLMQQLLKLDRIEAEGEAKVQRKLEVDRVQSYVDTLDRLKDRNLNTPSSGKAVFPTARWKTSGGSDSKG